METVPTWVWILIVVLAIAVAPIKLRIMKNLMKKRATPPQDE